MINYRGININKEDDYFITDGLKQTLGKDLKVLIQQESDEEYIRILTYFIDYVLDCKPIIKPEQTIAYHSWLLKFNQSSDLYYDIWEAKSDGENYVEGADYSIKVIRDQEDVCEKYGVSPIFPIFDQKVAISKGVIKGLGVDAVGIN